MFTHVKSSQNIGIVIRRAVSCDWRIVSCEFRTVAFRPITNEDLQFARCEDCEEKSKFFVVELTRFTPIGKISKYPLVWGWCGHCDIK